MGPPEKKKKTKLTALKLSMDLIEWNNQLKTDSNFGETKSCGLGMASHRMSCTLSTIQCMMSYLLKQNAQKLSLPSGHYELFKLLNLLCREREHSHDWSDLCYSPIKMQLLLHKVGARRAISEPRGYSGASHFYDRLGNRIMGQHNKGRGFPCGANGKESAC